MIFTHIQRLATWILPVALLAGCGNSGEKTDKGQTAHITDSLKYIVLEDASQPLGSWSTENTVVMHCLAEPDNLHPTNGTSGIRTEIFVYTQMALVRVDFRTLELAPALLESLPQVEPGGTRYTCTLRKEPRWDDGSAVTAADVIFTAMASKCALTENPMAKPYWDNVKQITPDPSDPLKFTVEMKAPYIHNVAFWGDWPIMQKARFDTENLLGGFTFDQFNDTTFDAGRHKALVDWATAFNDARNGRDPAFLSGLGPYKVTAWDPGISVTLEKKPNHWTKNQTDIYESSYPDKIIFRVNKDPNSQILDFKAQVLDGSTNISAKTLLELQSDSVFNSNYHSLFSDSYNYTYIGMNTRPDGVKHKPIFTDRLTRRAMALLTPVDELNRVINKGMNKRMTTPVSILKSEHDHTLPPIPYDPAEAKKLLAQAGWQDSDKDGILDRMVDGNKVIFEFSLNYITNTPEWLDYATIVAESWRKAGMKVNLNPLDFAVSSANAKQHDFDVMIAVWGGSAMPEDFTQIWHTSSWESGGSNYTGFGNEASDALIDSIKTIVNLEERAPLARRFQKMVYEEQPMIFLFNSMRRNIVHRRFGNVEVYFERPGLLMNNFKLITSSPQVSP